MPAPARRRGTAAAIALTSAVTGTALLLSGCGPDDAAKALPTSASSTPVAPGVPGVPVNPPTSARPTRTAPPAMNGTAHSRLTISNGTRYVLMNGTSVDFGTAVRDLAWNADGSRAAFVDGDGDLVTADPDGRRRVIVAKHIPGQSWSHPAWQFVGADQNGTVFEDILLVSDSGGVTTLETAPSDADREVTPAPLPLAATDDHRELPQTANTWPNGARTPGAVVYANSQTGDVYLRDVYSRSQVLVSLSTTGSEPALSADGRELVFVRSVGGHDHLFESAVGNHGTFEAGVQARDLTPKATVDYTEPAISPDGTTIAVRTPEGIATLPADGSAAPTLISTYQGLPAYR